MDQTVYISDNFLSAGNTHIRDSNNQVIGSLDLQSMFRTSVSVADLNETTQASGKFKGLFGKWTVFNRQMEALGTVQSVFLSFSKKYTYHSLNRGEFSIESLAFSRSYVINDSRNNEIASFKRVNNFFSSPAYEVRNTTGFFTMEELIVVVMGVNAIQKQRKRSNSNTHHHHH